MTEQFCFQVQDSGEGPLQVLVPANQVGEFKGLLREMGERAVEVVSLEEQAGAVSEESFEEPQAAGLCCPLDDGPWKDSPCEELTGWSEEEAAQKLVKLSITARLSDH